MDIPHEGLRPAPLRPGVARASAKAPASDAISVASSLESESENVRLDFECPMTMEEFQPGEVVVLLPDGSTHIKKSFLDEYLKNPMKKRIGAHGEAEWQNPFSPGVFYPASAFTIDRAFMRLVERRAQTQALKDGRLQKKLAQLQRLKQQEQALVHEQQAREQIERQVKERESRLAEAEQEKLVLQRQLQEQVQQQKVELEAKEVAAAAKEAAMAARLQQMQQQLLQQQNSLREMAEGPLEQKQPVELVRHQQTVNRMPPPLSPAMEGQDKKKIEASLREARAFLEEVRIGIIRPSMEALRGILDDVDVLTAALRALKDREAGVPE